MARRTREEMCHDLKNKRSRLYYKRKKILTAEAGASDKQYGKLQNQLQRVNYQIDSTNVRLFKCGVRFTKLKDAKRKVQRHMYYVKHKLRNRDIPQKERNKLLRELEATRNKINDYDILLGADFFIKKGEVKTVARPSERIIISVEPVWIGVEEIMFLVRSGVYATIDIEGDVLSIDQIQQIQFALDDFKANVISRRRETGTPLVRYEANEITSHIMVEMYIPSKHG